MAQQGDKCCRIIRQFIGCRYFRDYYGIIRRSGEGETVSFQYVRLRQSWKFLPAGIECLAQRRIFVQQDSSFLPVVEQH